MKTNLIISLFITFFLCSCEWKSDVDDPVLNKLGTGHGIVTYTDYEPLKTKPINLHFYIGRRHQDHADRVYPTRNRKKRQRLPGSVDEEF